MKIKLGDITPRMSNNICLNVDGDCGVCPLGGCFGDPQNKTHYYCKMDDVLMDAGSDHPITFDKEVDIPEGLLKEVARKVYTEKKEEEK